MEKIELLEHNIVRFLKKTGDMPSSIILHPKFIHGLIDEYKKQIEIIYPMNIYELPFKYRGIVIYESSQLNEGQIELTLKL
jgi:hypothetical protein